MPTKSTSPKAADAPAELGVYRFGPKPKWPMCAASVALHSGRTSSPTGQVKATVAADVEASINDEETIGRRPHRTPVAVRALLGENHRRKRNGLRTLDVV